MNEATVWLLSLLAIFALILYLAMMDDYINLRLGLTFLLVIVAFCGMIRFMFTHPIEPTADNPPPCACCCAEECTVLEVLNIVKGGK